MTEERVAKTSLRVVQLPSSCCAKQTIFVNSTQPFLATTTSPLWLHINILNMRQSLVPPFRRRRPRPRRQPPWSVEEDVYLCLARLYLPDHSSHQMSHIISDWNCYCVVHRRDRIPHHTANDIQNRWDRHLCLRLDEPQHAARTRAWNWIRDRANSDEVTWIRNHLRGQYLQFPV